ncbi:MAG: hypothetical protein CVT92_12510 [Bacteroidetes bacterium HGW-Bacteroidetes-1]|jgi:hypothetical protein|nr:MAG: hypothetical protein CVT92_12510 [Bacteroidetes bacterium HGW-Bacteroidetes-1]
MDLSKIVSISGKPGLFKITGQGKNNVLVESLLDGKRFAAFSHHRMSTLEEISIFTTSDDMPLKEVFKSIHKEMGEQLDFDAKKLSPEQLREKFTLVVPEYNEEAVYVSDIKKVFSWYNILTKNNLLDFSEPIEEETQQTESPKTDDTVSE